MGAKKLKTGARPRVIQYHDYRHFLKDWLHYLESQKLSLRQIARDAKVGASFLSMMVNGHRGLSKDMFDKIRPHLKLSEKECDLLELLRELAESSTVGGRARVFHNVLRFPEYKDHHPKEFETFHYLSSWYFVVIREMAQFPDFQFDAVWIQSQLRDKVAVEDIQRALQFLEAHGLLSRVKPYLTKKTLECMGGVFTLSLGNFHKQMLQLAGEAIDSVPRDERYLLGHTMAIANKDYPQVQKILSDALEQLERLSETVSHAESVYHVTLAAIPLTKKKSGAA